MRNLKKLLALVLAMVMALSLMVSVSAADVKYSDYPDKDSITEEFTEAVQVLTGLKVMQGDEGGFRPADGIRRSEAAAIIYRISTGDVNDEQVGLYNDYSKFTDVSANDWFAGYVSYCEDAGIIKGRSATVFDPYSNVTGYELLTMLLRAVGYGYENEFTGAGWQTTALSRAESLHITDNVKEANFMTTLNRAARRDVVADLVFQTIARVPTVSHSALGYSDRISLTETRKNTTLGQKIFGLWHDTDWRVVDEWGRPGYYWGKNGSHALGTVSDSSTSSQNRQYLYDVNWMPVFFGSLGTNNSNVVATIVAKPTYETKEQVRECDVAEALKIEVEDDFNLYVNGGHTNTTDDAQLITDKYHIVATDTVTKVGGQGRVTEFYYKIKSPWITAANPTNKWAVMIDTMLAKVTAKHAVDLDRNNHVVVPARLEVDIYDDVTDITGEIRGNSPSKRIISKKSTDATNWDEFSVGDYILINAYTNLSAAGSVEHLSTQEKREKAAFETNKVIVGQLPASGVGVLTVGKNVWIVDNGSKGIAQSKQARQTTTYWNAGKHNVDGTDVPDQICLFLDKAGRTVNTTYNWYFDQFGNVIGIAEAKGTQFGVITAVYSAQTQGETDTNGATKAIATVKFADGTTGTVEIDRFLMSTQTDDNAAAPANNTNAADPVWYDRQLPGLKALTNGQWTVDLRPQYNVNTGNPMSAAAPFTSFSTGGNADKIGWVYMSPDRSLNTQAHFRTAGSYDSYDILWDNLFMFTTANDNALVAIEVAGLKAGAGNSGNWANFRNAIVGDTNNDGAYGAVDANYGDGLPRDTLGRISDGSEGNIGKLYKNLAFLTLNTGLTLAGFDAQRGNPGNGDIRLESDTAIMVRGGTSASNSKVNVYKLSDLTGDITLLPGTEVDWADVDGDGRAEFVYINGADVVGTRVFGMFYYDGYNGKTAVWSDGKGEVPGYLNGEEYTAVFKNRTQFNSVVDALGSYSAHLFALEIVDGEVANVLTTVNNATYTNGSTPTVTENTANSVQILNNSANASWTVLTNTDVTGGDPWGDADVVSGFGLGSANGNRYSQTTRAVYFRDRQEEGANRFTVTYNSASTTNLGDTLTVAGKDGTGANLTMGNFGTFWLTASSNVVGNLNWLNMYDCDVTIVYDNTATYNGFAILDLYITPDPDVTPSDGTVPAPAFEDYFVYYTAQSTGGTWGTKHFTSGVRAYNNVSDLANAYVAPNVMSFSLSTSDLYAAVRVSADGTDSTGNGINATGSTFNNEYTQLYRTASDAIAAARLAGDTGFVTDDHITVNAGDTGYFVARNWIAATPTVPAHFVYALVYVTVGVN